MLRGVDAVKKKFLLLTMLTLTALLFTGCAMRTVEDMYALRLMLAVKNTKYHFEYENPNPNGSPPS